MDRNQNENQWDDEAVYDPEADMVPSEEPKEEYKGKETRAAGWRVLAVVFMLLGVGGLFLGLAERAASFMQPVRVFSAYGTTLTGSLIGYAVDYFKYFFENTSAIFSSGAAAALSSLTELLLVVALMVAAIVSVVAFFISLFSKRRAKTVALLSGILVSLTYLGLFLWSYFQMSMAATIAGMTAPTREICDIPTAIVAVVALFALCVATIASDRRLTANAIMLIIPLLAAFLMCYPGTETVMLASMGILSFGSAAFAKLATLFFMIVIAFNIAVSAIRIALPRHYLFDCVRFALMFIGASLTVIAFIAAAPNDKMAIFRGTQLFCTIGWLALAALGFVLAVVIAVYAKRAEEEDEEEYDDEDYDEDYDEDDEPEEEPVEVPAAEEPAPEPEPQPEEEPVEVPVVEEPAPEPEPEEEETPVSEFERKMAALARGVEPVAAPQPAAQPPVQPQPVYPPIAPRTAGMPIQQRMAGFIYPDINQYTYDPFINSLTQDEKNEFGDLFIACKTGRFEGLPIYVIGGNNEEFFRKVFIYLGKFRKDISAELLDKLYLFVSKNG